MPSGQDFNKIQSIITRPQATRVVGGRKVEFRRWAGVLLLAASIGLPFQSVVKDSGVFHELAGALAPAAEVKSAPEQLKWVSLPSSPFLEVGRGDGGTFSIPKMVGAWERAGLPEDDAVPVAKKINLMRPVLLGRVDPKLEGQLIAQAAQAAQDLRQAYPQVHAYLESGEENPAAKPWRGGLYEVEHLLSNPLPEKDWTLPVRLEKMAAWNDSAPSPAMHLEVPAVLLPGITPEGFSSQALVRAWKGSGMSPSQAFSALELVKRAIPDMEHVSSGKRTPLIMRSLATNLEIQEKFAPYLDSMSQSQGVESDEEVLPEGWTQDSWDAMWENVEAHVRASGDVPSVMPGEGGMEQALTSLGKIVQITGLRSLSPTLDAWQSPEAMFEIAERLEKANAQLEQITGWEGKVLGMDGRVELTLGRPLHQEGYGGMVSASRDGRVQMFSSWRAIGHEWFHTFDFVVSRTTMARSTIDTLSSNMQPLRQVSNPHVHSAMAQALRTADEDTPLWQMSRESFSKETGNPYWVLPSEVMANGFATVVEELYQADALGVIPENRRQRREYPVKGPSQWEVQALQAPFQALFDAAKPLGLAGSSSSLSTDFPQVSMAGNLSEWRVQRAANMEGSSPGPVNVSASPVLR